ncbi:MAG: copper-transporting ATPase, partial [Clostridia bacterium]|nr:copper-transporting ATPase [Clostridia bacterium]
MNENIKPRYYCPMRCEADKTYPEKGRCPVCNMWLVNDAEKSSAPAKHQHHAHQEKVIASADKHASANKTTNGAWYCPMKCEGEKTYPEKGRCPVCNMWLVNDAEKSSAQAKHQHHA